MANTTINDVAVLGGTIMSRCFGIWSADLVIDQPDGSGFAPGTKVTIKSEEVEWKGVVAPDQGGAVLDAVHVRVLGGAGGMAKSAKPRSFVAPGALARDVSKKLAEDAGETLSADTSSAFQNANLNAWAVTAMPTSQALLILMAVVLPGSTWRILANGELWVGNETWPESSAEFVLLEVSPAEGTALLGVDTPAIMPGTALPAVAEWPGGHVNSVEHQIFKDKIRTRVWLDQVADDRGAAASIGAMARAEMAKIDYFALYAYKVKSQSSDLTTVDIEPVAPNDKRLPGLSKVPVRVASAVKVQFVTDAQVLVGWDAGDPSRPYCGLGLSSDSVQRIQLGGNVDGARKGDHSDGGVLTLILTGTTVLSGTYVDPDGASTPVTSGAAIALKGKINEGSSKVGLG